MPVAYPTEGHKHDQDTTLTLIRMTLGRDKMDLEVTREESRALCSDGDTKWHDPTTQVMNDPNDNSWLKVQ